MSENEFAKRLKVLNTNYEKLIRRANKKLEPGNGIYSRYQHPVLTAAHTPLYWRYDLDYKTNPFLMERMGINSVFNAGALEYENKILLVARVEGHDRKSFFAIAESKNGIDNFRFRDYPMLLPETDEPETNVYDMRLVRHEDGWIYGTFCAERKDTTAAPGDTSSASAQCGIIRTKDLKNWERLPDLKTKSPQQRNVVLHPEFVDGYYAFYTRPQDGFIDAGSGEGIAWGLARSMDPAIIEQETVLDARAYHTIKEAKNGQGPAPLRTPKGWLHIAHGVRNTAAGLRYVLYLFLTDLREPDKILYKPGGFFIAPEGEERIGDVSNVLFCNGAVARANGDVFIYYASSDTRLHVITSTCEKLLDYVMHTPEDGMRSSLCVKQRIALIDSNIRLRTATRLHPGIKEIKFTSAPNNSPGSQSKLENEMITNDC